MLGIPSIGGKDPVFNFTIDVAPDGKVFVNGLPFEARYMGSTESGELRYTSVAVIQVAIATHGTVTDGMKMPDVSESDVAAIAEFQAGVYAMILGNRDGIMVVDMIKKEVLFMTQRRQM